MNDLVVVQKIAGWEKLKALVLDSVSSPITKRVYNMALEEFLVWFQQAPRPGFTKATVSAWRVALEARGLGSSSIIIVPLSECTPEERAALDRFEIEYEGAARRTTAPINIHDPPSRLQHKPARNV